jgi:AcrR family transcriptional regulator
MGINERKARQKTELRKKILKSARTLARKEGWEAVTTRKLAEKVEYSTTVIYEYFGNKDQLLLLLREEGFERLQQAVEKALDPSLPPRKQLVAAGIASWNFAKEKPEYYQVMFNLGGIHCRIEKESEALHKAAAVVFRILDQANVVDTESVFMNWWSIVHGFIALEVNGQMPFESRNMEKFLKEALERLTRQL